MRRDLVPLRPSAASRRRLWRLWAVTPRLTRAMTVFGLLQVRQQAAHLLGVLRPDHGLAGVAPRPTGRLDLEVMPTPCVDADDLAGAGHADPLLGCLVALDLGHPGLTLLFGPARPACSSSSSRRPEPALVSSSVPLSEPVLASSSWRRPEPALVSPS